MPKPRTPPGPARGEAKRYAAVLEIARALGSTRDLDGLLALVMRRVTRVMAADRSTLFLVDPERRELWSKVAQGSRRQEIRLPLDSGLAGWAARTGRTLDVADAYRDPRFNARVDERTGYRTRSVHCVPIRDRARKVVGVIQVLRGRVDPFRAQDARLLKVIASQLAVAIETARLYQDALARNRELLEAQARLKLALSELDVLFAIEKTLSESGGLDGVIDGIVGQAMALCGAEAGSVLLLEHETGQLYFKSALGSKGEEVKKFRLGLGQGIAGHVAEEGRPVLANEVAREATWDPAIAHQIGYPTRSALCVPIRTEDGVIGALELLNKPAGFDADDLRRLTLVAGQTARAVQVGRGRDARDRSARLASIGQMLSGVLHDLKTPMTVIAGYAELMAEEPQADTRKRYGALVMKQFEQVGAMTREILQFARGERELLVRNVYLNVFLEEMREYLEREFAGKRVKLRIQAAYQGLARFDENKIARVIHNLARNAAQAMPEGGRFTIRVRRVDGSLELGFADTGPGIPPEIAGQLFEAFVTKGKEDSTGLGLAIVKKAVEDHGGSVSYESRPGRGTTFQIRLPL